MPVGIYYVSTCRGGGGVVATIDAMPDDWIDPSAGEPVLEHPIMAASAYRIVRDSNWYQARPRYLIYDLRRAERGFDRIHDSYERYLATRFKQTADRVVIDSYHADLCAYSRQASLLSLYCASSQYLTYVPLDDHARRLLSAWNLQLWSTCVVKPRNSRSLASLHVPWCIASVRHAVRLRAGPIDVGVCWELLCMQFCIDWSWQ